MDVWFDLDVTELTFAKGYLIELEFTYIVPGIRSVPKQKGNPVDGAHLTMGGIQLKSLHANPARPPCRLCALP